VIDRGQLIALDSISGLLERSQTRNLEQAFFQLIGSTDLFDRPERPR
jgi:ABC-type Na+ transport system ATPase subunit NatA